MTKKQENFEASKYRAWHLASSSHEAISTEFEWSMMRFQQAFERWVTQLAGVTGMGELSYIEAVIIHIIRMHDRPKSATDIARQLNRDDIPNIQYCLRKLVKTGFCERIKDRSRKTAAYRVTAKGRKLTENYAELRKRILMAQSENIDRVDEKLDETNKMISIMTGLYDEAGRITATYNPATEGNDT